MSDRLRHVIGLLSAPWAITPEGFETVCMILDRRAAGIRLSQDEIRAIVDESRAEWERGHEAATMLGKPAANGTLAVISLYGTIIPRPVMDISGPGGASLTQFMDTFQQADGDPNVKAILLDVDSPGGSAALVPEAAAMVRNAQTPTTAVANTMAASAAYYIAAQADTLVATPSGLVGSIGVFARHVDISAALEQDGVKVSLISAGDFKVEGNPYEPLSDTARAAIQTTVDSFYNMFVEDVAKGRGTDTDDVLANYGQGRILTAQQALAAGMVDRVDTLEATAQGILRDQTTSLRANAGTTKVVGSEGWVVTNGPVAYALPEGTAITSPTPISPEASPVDPEERQGGADKPAPLQPGNYRRAVVGR